MPRSYRLEETMLKPIPPSFSEEDAFHIIVQYMRAPVQSSYSSYGYEIYLPIIIRLYLEKEFQVMHHQAETYVRSLSPHFYAAGWELCRRGILRPGITQEGAQATPDGASGNGYSITPAGRKWMTEAGRYDYVPTEPGRFSKILDSFSPRLGIAYRERSQEALRCYNAQAYLACCAMCGAAAESILLSLAITKNGNEEVITQDYMSKGGRGRVENLIVGQKHRLIQDEFRANLNLLKYWRDVASHGRIAGIEENEAFTSLAILLRLARFAFDKWADLEHFLFSHTEYPACWK